MKELHDKMDPSEFKKNSEGYFTSRRLDVIFSGIASDQTIEQTLMKGMSVEKGIENFCNISFNKSHQHSDSTDARIHRDDIDVKLLVDFFIRHSPFPDTDAIISIATGITRDKDINCVTMLLNKVWM
ncbi:uncharacterized protein TNCV_1424801 [Trichonephila clavipes]|nr:uncharacterized protein TNCV_1424801 [Trichonephila clavipes]